MAGRLSSPIIAIPTSPKRWLAGTRRRGGSDCLRRQPPAPAKGTVARPGDSTPRRRGPLEPNRGSSPHFSVEVSDSVASNTKPPPVTLRASLMLPSLLLAPRFDHAMTDHVADRRRDPDDQRREHVRLNAMNRKPTNDGALETMIPTAIPTSEVPTRIPQRTNIGWLAVRDQPEQGPPRANRQHQADGEIHAEHAEDSCQCRCRSAPPQTRAPATHGGCIVRRRLAVCKNHAPKQRPDREHRERLCSVRNGACERSRQSALEPRFGGDPAGFHGRGELLVVAVVLVGVGL